MNTAKRIVVTLGLLAWSASASAYDGTPAEQEACTPDVFSLCAAYIPNEDPILACLKSKRMQLSPACAQVLAPASRQAQRKGRAKR